MEDVPKVVRWRLEKGQKADLHPDADLLSAFVEKRLTPVDRQPIVEHLAECGDCREVLFLASAPEGTTLVQAPRRFQWFGPVALRWAAAGACVVVVGAAVTLHYQDQGKMAHFAPQRSSPTFVEKPAPAMASQAAVQDEKVSPKAAVGTSTVATKEDVTVGYLRKGAAPASPAELRADAVQVQAPGKLTYSPSMSPANAERRDAGARSSNEKVAEDKVMVAQANEPVLGKAKEAQKKITATGAMRMETASTATLDDMDRAGASVPARDNVVAVPRWTLSADGTLQRSLDGGTSWQSIAVAAKSKFRALAAFGLEIWVGGPAGALYHSVDAGGHWVRVEPVADGNALTADIIGVEFTDAKHGKLTTAADQTWLTSDGGQSWTKR